MNRKRYSKIVAAILGLVMALASGTGVYAFEGGEYHELRDGEVSLYLPDGWTSEEMIGFEGDEERKYEQIVAAWDENGSSGLNLDIYYLWDDVLQDDYVYFDGDEEEALEYYENYGEDAVDFLYGEILAWPEDAVESQWETPEPEFFDGEWNGFLVTDISGSVEVESGGMKDYAYTIYLTAEMTEDSETVVHNVLVFYNDDEAALTEEQDKLAREIAGEFYDYNYANEMMGVSTDDSGWDVDSDDGSDEAMDIILGIVGFVVPALICIATVVIALKKAVRRRREKPRRNVGAVRRKISHEITDAQSSFDLDKTISSWKKRRAEKSSFSDREQKSEQRAERRQGRRTERSSTMQMRTREAESAEQRYYESLQTLLRTGLLTKSEMRDMLERHHRSRARQRNQGRPWRTGK